MVCLGNICRSPLAEGILKDKVAKQHLSWEIDSAGTSQWHIGNPPDHRSVATAKQHGIDITNQRARQFKAADLTNFDLILAMDASNYNDILRFTKDHQHPKVQLILNYLYPNENRVVPDPYYNDGFEKVYQLLDAACTKIIEKYGVGEE